MFFSLLLFTIRIAFEHKVASDWSAFLEYEKYIFRKYTFGKYAVRKYSFIKYTIGNTLLENTLWKIRFWKKREGWHLYGLAMWELRQMEAI